MTDGGPAPTRNQVLECTKTQLFNISVVEEAIQPLADGEALLAIERFSLTANNVTYGVYGAAMAYWDFFPASAPDQGRVPVWGYGRVVDSRAEGVAVGTRLYGYFPMAQFLKVQPVKITPHGFGDGQAHRQAMAGAYNYYEAAPELETDVCNRIALLRPLFITGFLLDDWISSQKARGGVQIIASSASSKTALAMASCLKARAGLSLIGLTSARSKDFVRGTGFYDQTLTYDEITDLPQANSVYVDFAGDGGITQAVHATLNTRLTQSIIVGGSHWDADRLDTRELPGPKPEFFFAPTHIGRLGTEWGGAAFHQAVHSALMAFVSGSKSWLTVQSGHGLDHAQMVWAQLLSNAYKPSEGAIITL